MKLINSNTQTPSLSFVSPKPPSPPEGGFADEATHIHNIFRNFSMSE